MSAVYGYVTEKIVSLLESGVVPWERPWNGAAGFPKNLVSGKEYRGINVFLLSAMNFVSPYWLTFNQCKAKGGSVRAGEKSSMVVFFKTLEILESEKEDSRKIPMLRYYRVFNTAQCEGLRDAELSGPADTSPPVPADERADGMVAAMMARPVAPNISHGKVQALYRPSTDTVEMPDRHAFKDTDAYYRVLFHELTHATGHATRLNRADSNGAQGFFSQAYGKEELVAEMGAAFLCGHAGLDGREERSASYLQSWIKALKGNPRMVVQAASAAQKASEWVMGGAS